MQGSTSNRARSFLRLKMWGFQECKQPRKTYTALSQADLSLHDLTGGWGLHFQEDLVIHQLCLRILSTHRLNQHLCRRAPGRIELPSNNCQSQIKLEPILLAQCWKTCDDVPFSLASSTAPSSGERPDNESPEYSTRNFLTLGCIC